jgi:hypothetical protein
VIAHRKPTNLRLIVLVAAAGVTVTSVVAATAAGALSANGSSRKDVGGDNAAVAQAATPPTDEAAPFHISGPNSEPENLAGAQGLENLVPETDLAKIRVEIPATRTLAPEDLVRFKLTAAVGRKNADGFGSGTYYRDDSARQFLSLGAWNKVGEFNIVVTPGSPVMDSKVTTIDGLPALTMLPTANVVGGLGPRTVYLYREGIIYAIHGEGFLSDESFMSVVHNFVGEITK